MKTILVALLMIAAALPAAAQSPAYNLILKNDGLVDSMTYEFEIWIETASGADFELASLQPIMRFNTGIGGGTLSLSLNSGTSGLNASQVPTTMSVTGGELRINPRVPPGAGSGTIIAVSPGRRVGRFRLSGTQAFAAQQANIAWKNASNPFTKVFEYDAASQNVEITDSTGHLNSLLNPTLSPPVITSTSPRPAATAGTPYADTLRAQGGSGSLTWSVILGSTPSGISLASTGILSGTSTAAGTSVFTARVADNTGSADTAQFSLTVNAGTAAQLAFVQQPSTTTAGVFVSPAPSVRLRDAFGNPVSTAGVAVSMSLTGGNGILSGSLSELTNASGIATFDSLSIDRSGTKTITASSGITSSVASSPFSIVSAAAATVRVETAADGSGVVVPAQNLAPPGSLTMFSISRDAFENFVANVAANAWSLAGATGGVVAGDLAPAGDSKSAVFTANAAGSARVRATSPPLTPVESGTISVVAGASRRLTFTQQPSNGIAGAAIAPPVTVQVRDTANNPVAVESLSISMTLNSGTGTLGGTMTRLTNASGLATFNNLTIDASGQKTLRASSPGLTSAVSGTFTLDTYTITSSAGPNGTIAPSGAVPVNSGASRAFTITPNANFHVANVLVDGASVGAVTSYTFTNVTSNHTISATFAPDTVPVTVQTAPPGRSVRVDGVLLTAPQNFNWISGSVHTIETDSIQNGAAGVRYLFDSWSDAGARSHSVSPTTAATYTAAFDTQYFLTMNAGTGGSVSPASAWRNAGEVVGISATPAVGFSFTGWTGTGSGSFTGATNPSSVTMNGPITQTGNFGANTVSVTVTTVPAGRQIIVDGVTYTSPQVFNWTATQSHTIAADSVQSGGAGVRHLFASWSDGGARSHTVTPVSDSAFTATFTTQYFLAMNAGAGGSVAPASDWKTPGQVVQISATPSAGYSFGGWTGTGSGSFTGSTNPVNVTMNGPVTQTGSFTANPITYTVTTSPVGRTIFVDDTAYIAPKTFNWFADQDHTVSVDSIQNGAAGTRHPFVSWSDGGARSHTIRPLASGSVTATLSTQHFLTMVANPGGTVTPASGWHNDGADVLITGVPNSGFVFQSWSGVGDGSYSGNANPQSISIDGPVTQTANFVQPSVQVTIQTNPPGRTFRVDNGSLRTNTYTFSFAPGTTHDVTTDSIQNQTSSSRFVWTSWSDGGARSHTLVYPGKDTTITVNFKRQFFLTMNAATGGSTSPPSGFFDSAQVVAISATPDPSFSFTGWTGSGTGSYSGPNNPANVTVRSAITETPSFTLTPINVTVQSNPAGRTFEVDGVTYTGSQSFIWSATSIHNLGTTSPQGDTATQYLFASWSDGGAQSHGVAPLTDTVFTVNFTTQHFLTMSAGTGLGTVSPASGWYDAGTPVQISATPNTGYNFAGWTGFGASAYSGPNNPASITMNSPVRETATWSAGTVPITVTTVPSGRSIIVDGITYTSPRSFTWTTGSTHTIGADSIQASGSPGTRHRWTSWSDGGARSHQVTPFAAATYTAGFQTQYQLTMSANPGGTVTPATGWHDSSAAVVITGIPDPGYQFDNWSGTGPGSYSGSANPRSISVRGPVTQTANFEQVPVQVTIVTDPPGRHFRVDNGPLRTSIYTFTFDPADAPHSLSADSIQTQTAASRFVWTSWSDGGARSHTILYPGRDTTFVVSFKRQFFLTMNAGAGGTVLPASDWFDSSQTVGISAAPSGSYTFSGWTGSGSGSYSGPANPSQVRMDTAITETANFTLSPISVTITTVPAGRQFLVDSVPYTGPQSFVWSATEPHTISAPSPQGDTATRYLFTGWSDGGSQTHSVAPSGDTSFTASFQTQHYLTMDTGTGNGSVSPASGWHNAGASVQISATPDAGYTFGGWTGTGSGSYTGPNAAANVTLNGPVRQIPSWGTGTVPVTIATSPPGLSVIVDGIAYASPQVFNWTTGSTHTIGADSLQPAGTGTRYRWTSWSDAGALVHTVAPTSAATYTATFGTQYLLTMSANPGGSVAPPTGWYDAGTQVLINGIPDPGFSFGSWTGLGSGSYSGNTNPRQITVNGPISQTGNFVQNPYQVTVRTIPDGRTFRVSGTNYTTLQTFSVAPGNIMSFSIPVNPQSGPPGIQYVWRDWSDSGAMSHTFTPVSDTTITATFSTQYYLTMNAGSGGTVAPPSGWQDSGAVVPISATPSAGFTFSGWTGSGPGAYSGANNPSSVTMRGPITETGSFTLFPITVRLRSNPPGRTVLVDSVAYVTPQDIVWTSGTSHTLSADSVQPGAEGVRHLWTAWSDGKARTHSVTGLSDTTFTADFRPQYFLTMTAGTGGTALPASGWHDSAAVVPISAAAGAGYEFTGWIGTGTGSYTGTLNPSSATMLGPVAQEASFRRKTVSVTVRTAPDGQPILVDDTVYTSPRTFLWQAGSQHTVSTDSVHPPSGGTRLVWTSWSDGGARTHTIAPTGDSTFTANLVTQHYLTMLANPGGTVTPASGWYNADQTVALHAVPNTGFTFASWSGSGTGSYTGLTNPRNISIGGPITQTANFNQNTVLITVMTDPPGRTFRVNGTSYTSINTFSFLPGTSQALSADSIQPGVNGRRHVWRTWSDSGARTHNFVVPTRDSTIVATFGLQYELTTFASPTNGGTVQPGGQSYHDEGDTVSALAVSNPGFAFSSWSGASPAGANPVSVIMDTARILTANFLPAATVLIQSDPPGRTVVVDGFAFVAPDTFSWLLGSTHTIGSLTPQDGEVATRHLWTGWSDGGAISHSVTVNRDTAFTAVFQTQHYLFIATDGNGTVQPAEGWYNAGSAVTVTAAPASGFGFIGWAGSGPAGYTGFSNPASLTMSGWASQSASFGQALPPPTLTGILNNAVDQPIRPRISWMRYPDADSYIVQVATDSAFSNRSNVVDSAGISDTTMLLPTLRNVARYFWRVKARVGADVTVFSETRQFTTVGATIAVTSPAINWGTGFSYDISWTALNLAGTVDVLLSIDGGLTFTRIDSGLAGNATRYRVAPTQTPSNFCVVRVVSTANGQFFGDSRTFAILPGALPLIVPVSAVIPFPAEPTISTFYRLVSHPGVVDTSIRLAALLPGSSPHDWRMFADNGLPSNYLVEMGPGSSFETGRGYWFLKRHDLGISANMVMPPLDTINGTYRIRLRPGWNIIANPFDRNVTWSSILALNGLPPSNALYGYEGSYLAALSLSPFRGYYYFNPGNLTELKIPYPFGTVLPSAAVPRGVEWEVRIGYESEVNDDPANYVGVAAAAAEGLDPLDSRKPPVFLDQGFLSFKRPAWDPEYQHFSADFRPSVGEGQSWEFEVTREHGTTGTLRFEGIESVPAGYEVVLLNRLNSVPVDLRERALYSFASVSTTMPFRLLVGTPEFVRREAAAEVPEEFALSQNYPNPFNASTSIGVRLPRDARIRLDVYSLLGQKVRTLAEGQYPAGVHTFLWEGTDDRGMPVASGVYLYRLTDGASLVQAKKMIITK